MQMQSLTDLIDYLTKHQRPSKIDRSTIGEAFTFHSGINTPVPVLFSSPHSGRIYPAEFLRAIQVPLIQLRQMEDAYVDEIFEDVIWYGANIINARIARSYVDLNRGPYDIDWDMFVGDTNWLLKTIGSKAINRARIRAGLGCFPKIDAYGLAIYSQKLTLKEGAIRLGQIYQPYHARLSQTLHDMQNRFGGYVLVDCHSMPSSSTDNLSTDIILGDRFGKTCHPDLVSHIEINLRNMGYKVMRNHHFSGGYITQTYSDKPNRGYALQIEINRALYLNEQDISKTSTFKHLKEDMTILSAHIIDWAKHYFHIASDTSTPCIRDYPKSD